MDRKYIETGAVQQINNTLGDGNSNLKLQMSVEWGLVGILLFVLLASLYSLYRVTLKGKRSQFPLTSKLVHILITFAVICMLGFTSAIKNYNMIVARIVNSLVIIYHGDLQKPIYRQTEWHSIVLGGLPGYLYFATFTLLGFYWYIRITRSQSSEDPDVAEAKMEAAYYGIVTCVVVIWTSFWMLLLFYRRKPSIFNNIHLVELLFSTAIQYLTSGLYLFVGIRLYCLRRTNPPSNARQHRLNRVIGVVAAFCMIIFCLRATTLLFLYFVYSSSTLGTIMHILWTLLYDAAPALVIIFALGRSIPSTIGAKGYLSRHGMKNNEELLASADVMM